MIDFITIDENNYKNGYKMYFDTGVTPYGHNPPIKLFDEYEAWRNGTKQIIYYLESAPPDGYKLMWLCDNHETGELAIPIIGGGMTSKFAIFNKIK